MRERAASRSAWLIGFSRRMKLAQYIGKLYKAGILVMRGRLVDVAASDTVLDAGAS